MNQASRTKLKSQDHFRVQIDGESYVELFDIDLMKHSYPDVCDVRQCAA